jgi:hypothetical protein
VRVVNYKTHWSYAGRAVKRQEPLADFVLDVLYLMEDNGVIPPLHVLNEILQDGGSNGGMGPGTSWRGFKIKSEEYNELIQALLSLNIEEAKQKHPYVRFQKVIVDEELNQASTHHEWLSAVIAKYPNHA